MGALLDQYLSTFGQSLQQLAAPPGGAQTFPTQGPGAQPLDPRLAAMPQEPTFAEPPPAGGMTAAGVPVGQTFETGGEVATAPAPSFEAQPGTVQPVAGPGGGPAEAQPLLPFDQEQPVDLPTFEAPPEEEVTQPTPAEGAPGGLPPGTQPTAPGEPRGRGKGGAQVAEGGEILQAGDVENPEDLMAAATDEEIAKGTDVVEQQLEEQGSSLDEAYEKVTGGPPDTRLSREEKGQLLMEFGLRMLAYSGQEGAEFEAIGRAGIETLGSARAMREAKRARPGEERKSQLELDLLEAQITREQAGVNEIITDKDGNLVSVNKATNAVTPITDASGNPVTAETDASQFESQLNRDAYRQYFIDTVGECDSACERGALAYSKGGAAQVAFPELLRADQTDRVMKVFENPDNSSRRYPIPSTGKQKRWKDMTEEEKFEVANGFVERRLRILDGGGPTGKQGGAGRPAPTGWKNFETDAGMSEEIARQIPEGQGVDHPDGGQIVNRGGVLKRENDDGTPWTE